MFGLGAWPAAATEAPNWYLELPEDVVSETTARRTLALELREVEVPASPLRHGDESSQVQLHVRVSAEPAADDSQKPALLVIEVWDRGESAGRRRVSARGDPSTVGRRAALAAVELVRQLGFTRSRLARLQAKRKEERRREEQRLAQKQRRRRLAIDSRLSSLVLPEGGWLVGPGLGVELNSQFPLRLRGVLSHRTGSLSVEDGPEHTASYPWSHVDLSVSALWVGSVEGALAVEGGLLAGVSAVHLGGDLISEELTGLRDTWSSRLGGTVGATAPLGRGSRLRLGLTAGMTLRPVPFGREGVNSSLGGGFLGVHLALLVRPHLNQ